MEFVVISVRIFETSSRESPAQDVRKLRVEAAQRMIEQCDKGLDQIASACGFSSADLMRRAFVQILGKTPRALRSPVRDRPTGFRDYVPPGDGERPSFEAIALAAGVNIDHLPGSITLSLQAQAVNTVKIIPPQHQRPALYIGMHRRIWKSQAQVQLENLPKSGQLAGAGRGRTKV